MKPILLIGETGQLSRALARSLTARRMPYRAAGRYHADLAKNPESITPLIAASDVQAVINCSAYTDVDGAETEIDAARYLNALAPGFMADACAAKDIPFIHISTDYVFSGTAKRPYKPNSKITPINAYGKSKADGEAAIMKAGGQSLILRTSWLYGGTGRNFLTTMLGLARERKGVKIVNDQIGRPTYAGHLAEACLKALSRMPASPEIMHAANTGSPISWAEFAIAIFKAADIDCRVTGIPSSEYPTPAKRPAYSVMDTQMFEARFNHPLEPWQVGLDQALKEIL